MQKGIFQTISVFFLVLSLLAIAGVLVTIENGRMESHAAFSGIAEIGSIKSDIGWMTREAYAVSGYRYDAFGQTLLIYENASSSGSLSRDLGAIEGFWNGLSGKNVSLAFSPDASTPLLYIRPANITLIQGAAGTTLAVPSYSGPSVLAYYITIETSCGPLSKEWENISESSGPDALNFSIYLKCIDSDSSISDFRQLNRSAYSEFRVKDGSGNVTIVRIMDHGSLEIAKYRSSYLNIMLPMNQGGYFEVPSGLNISGNSGAFSGAIRMPGDIR